MHTQRMVHCCHPTHPARGFHNIKHSQDELTTLGGVEAVDYFNHLQGLPVAQAAVWL
jgi:hypothetical protein